MGDANRFAELTVAAGIGAAALFGVGCAIGGATASADDGTTSSARHERPAAAGGERRSAARSDAATKAPARWSRREVPADDAAGRPREKRRHTAKSDAATPDSSAAPNPGAGPDPAATATARRAQHHRPAAVDAEAAPTLQERLTAPAPAIPRQGLHVARTEFDAPDGTAWRVLELRPSAPSGKTVVALADASQPLLRSWFDYTRMARSTGATVVTPLPAQRGGAGDVAGAAAYVAARIADDGAGNVSVYGRGGALALAAVTELVGSGAPVPARLVLVSPTPVDTTNAELPPTLVVARSDAASRSGIDRGLGLNDAVDGPRTVRTGPPSLLDQLIVATLQNLRRNAPGLFGGDASGLTGTAPPAFVRHGITVTQTEYNGWTVWQLAAPQPSGEYVLALHGGGFVAEANVINWADYAAMARDTGATVLVPIYPLAPPVGTGTVPTLIPPMADYLSVLIAEHGAENVSLYGDSAGGTFAMLTAQELVRRCRATMGCVIADAEPSRMVLISPVLNLTLTGPIVDDIDDPIIPKPTPGAGGPDITGGLDPNDPRVNPISGADLTGLPPTTIYVGTVERPNPGDLMFRDKLLAQDPDADFTVVIGQGQIHDWALGGIFVNSQAPQWRPRIYQQLGLLPAND